MKISVIIPACNEESTLPHLLKSLGKQTLDKKQYEVIVVDNNSSDNTSSVALHFGARVVNESMQGIVYARQRGSLAAKGKIIVSTDADCIVPSDYLEKIYNEFDKDPNLYGLCGSVRMYSAPVIVKFFAYLISYYSHYHSRIFDKTPTCWALNFSFRKKAFNKLGGYSLESPLVKDNINTDSSDEFEFVKRLWNLNGKVYFNNKVVLKSSGRRHNGRLCYWFFIEFLIGLVINKRLYKYFNFYIPIPSYYTRKEPTTVTRVVFRFALSCLFIVLLSSSLATVYAAKNHGFHKEQIQESIVYYQSYEKQIMAKVKEPIVEKAY